MNWILDSMIATLGGGFYVSFLKLGQDHYETDSLVTFVLFGSFLYYFLTKNHANIVKDFNFMAFLSGISFGLTAYFISKSFQLVNNPGVPSSIVRSQVLLTYFVSLFLFNEKFSWKTFFPILIIIFGCLITIYPELINFDPKNMTWIFFTVLAGICTTGNDITSKLSLNEISNDQFLVIQMLGATLTNILIQYGQKKTFGLKKLKKPKKNSKILAFNKYPTLLLTIIIISLIIFREFLGSAMSKTKNPAYPRAIFNSQFIVSLLISLVIQKNSSISLIEGIGSAVITVGVILTSLIKR